MTDKTDDSKVSSSKTFRGECQTTVRLYNRALPQTAGLVVGEGGAFVQTIDSVKKDSLDRAAVVTSGGFEGTVYFETAHQRNRFVAVAETYLSEGMEGGAE